VARRREGIERRDYIRVVLIWTENLLELLTSIHFVAVGVKQEDVVWVWTVGVGQQYFVRIIGNIVESLLCPGVVDFSSKTVFARGTSKVWKLRELPTVIHSTTALSLVLIYNGLYDYTVNRKNTPTCFCHYLPQNPVDSDKIWYTLSRMNLRYSSLNVFQLTWIMLLHYLVKLSVRVLYANSYWNCEPKNTPDVFVTSFTKPGRFW